MMGKKEDNSCREQLSVSDQVKILRKQKGITQYVLASNIGTSQKAITRFENEEVKPNVSTLERIAEALDCDLDIRFMPREIEAEANVGADRTVKAESEDNLETNVGLDVIKKDISDIKREILAKIKGLG
jgi:transcriptional regulator with XRE-family HTH domain